MTSNAGSLTTRQLAALILIEMPLACQKCSCSDFDEGLPVPEVEDELAKRRAQKDRGTPS